MNTKRSKILFFGYPTKSMSYTGGFLWMKRVADQIEKSNRYSVSESYVYGSTKRIISRIYKKIHDLVKIIVFLPDVAIIDAWGELSIVIWLILRTCRKRTRIFVVFHHYERRIPVCKNYF